MTRRNYALIVGGLLAFIWSEMAVWSFTYKTHENIPEDAFIYMEKAGTNQQRWVADYLKAKAGGRYSGTCRQKSDDADDIHEGTVQTECGAIGISRVGGINPDYFRDTFWDDTTVYSWHFPNPFIKNNYTSWYHFINLLKTNSDGVALVTNNYNDYDGYAYNATYGFDEITGEDYLAAGTLMNNAWMTVNLPGCTHSNCSERYSIVPNGNPAIDYRQNGSTTTVSGGSGNKKTEQQNGTNYNCFSDTVWPNDCPDRGTLVGGIYQIPNTSPGDDWNFTSDQDWTIYEPADNVSTFYYHEFWLEGGASRNSSLQTGAIAGRYYNMTGPELIYLTVLTHWAADLNQQTHVWATIAYNHGPYEETTDEYYGTRVVGGSNPNKNLENYTWARAYADHRQSRYRGSGAIPTVEQLWMEQAFLTYHIRLRNGYDTMTHTDDTTRLTAAKWAVNNSIALISNYFEKGVLELRRHGK